MIFVPPTLAAIAVSPLRSLVDAPVSVRIKSAAGRSVTLRLTTQRYGMTFSSSMRVTAVDSDWHEIPDAMQLFWSVMPAGAPAENFSFRRDTDLEPRTVTIEATDGSETAGATIERVTLQTGVRRTVLDNGTLVASLFSRSDGACRPGVIVLGGSEGGVPEAMAAVLATRGFTTLALAYFNMPNLPSELVDVPIELVQNGVSFTKTSTAVCQDRPIGVLGASKGAELALVSAAHFRAIGAVVAISPPSVVFSGIGRGSGTASSWSYHGKPLPFANGVVPQSVSSAIRAERQAETPVSYDGEYSSMLENNTDAAAVIPVERIVGPVLLVAGGSDRLWPSMAMATQVENRLRAMRHPYSDSFLSYPSAGHAIGLPYQFAAAELAHSSIVLGGTPAANESASEDSWPKVAEFFSSALH